MRRRVKILDTQQVQAQFNGTRLACIESFNGFQVIRIEDDPTILNALAHDAQVNYRFVMEDDSLGTGIFHCSRARLYGIKNIDQDRETVPTVY